MIRNPLAARLFSSLIKASAPVSTRGLVQTSSSMTTSSHANGRKHEVSQRVRDTEEPPMVQARKLMGSKEGVLPLSQGQVYWLPPDQALKDAAAAVSEDATSRYNVDEGHPDLRAALQDKIETQNGLHGYNVIVTAGANQALSSCMLALVDPQDSVCIFKPYYFNCLMAIQMTGGKDTLRMGPSDPKTFQPDLDWLQGQLDGPDPPRLVYVVNPCNPTGITLERGVLEHLADMTQAAGAWLVMDDTYENFIYGDRPHVAINRPHVLHIFSFSKAWGLHGWRCGYIAYPNHDGKDYVGEHLIRIQDTIPIHAAIVTQRLATSCLTKEGTPWVRERVKDLAQNRTCLLEALKPLGTMDDGLWGGDAIYIWARLPEDCSDDKAVAKWLVHRHGVSVIPGSGCGAPGYVRVCFGVPKPEVFPQAAERLNKGLKQLVAEGFASTAGQM